MRPTVFLRAAITSVLALSALPGFAQTSPPAPAVPKLISIEISSATMRDALAAVEKITLLRLHPLWTDEQHSDGLDPDRLVSLHCRGVAPMVALESLLRQADPSATWQSGEGGEIEVGPRSRLNEHRVTRIYAVRDLLATVPDYREIPAIDLNAALQGAGASPLREEASSAAASDEPGPDPAKELIALITTTVEPDQWAQQGGPAMIVMYQNSLVVTAPEYIHRQLEHRVR